LFKFIVITVTDGYNI